MRVRDKSAQKQYNRAYYQKHKSRCDAQSRAWNLANPEKAQATRRRSAATWRKNHPDRYLATAKRAREKRTGWFKTLIRDLKAKACLDCGQFFPFYVMEFDHTRGEKLFNISAGTAMRGKTILLTELAKCDVICANDHRRRTYERKQQYRRKKHTND